jgi:oxygen-dependent protoporphyrinogen oxidase
MMQTDVLVIGAGISGLVCAWQLQQAGVRVATVDAAARAGGAIGSRREHGVLVEAGPNSMLETTPRIGELVAGLGLQAERLEPGAEAKKRFILRGGRLHAVPTSPGAFLRTPLFSFGAKAALLREPFVARGAADRDESVADFVRRRLGQEFLDYAINPFVSGVYAGNPEALSVHAAFPRLVELEQRYGSLIRGQILGARERRRTAERSKNTASMMTFRSGMQAMTDALASRLNTFLPDTSIAGLAYENGAYCATTADGRAFAARAVVIATPAHAARALVAPLAPDAAQALGEMTYPPVASVVSAYRREDVGHPLDGFGFLVPEKEKRRILGTIFSSSLFPGRGPAGMVVVTTFVGGMRQPDLGRAPDADILALVQAENAQLLDAAPAAASVSITRWAQAIPQYSLGHLERVARVDAATASLPGLHFCANWRGGIAVGDCIKSGFLAAERISAALAR